ncbi:hypothetical protein MPER_09056, partial [Moniliophthora perniciosa FA553]
LPRLKRQVEDKLRQCRMELSALPPPTDRPLIQLMELIRLFAEDVNKAVFGLEHRRYAQQNRIDIYADFRAKIWSTGIDFKPTPHSNVSRQHEDPWDHSSVPQPERVPMPDFKISMDLDDVREVINQSVAWELPGHVPFQATIELVRLSTSRWREPALTCFDTGFERSWRLFDEMITERFGTFHSLRNFVRPAEKRHW